MKHGFGIFQWSSGNKYIGQFKNDEREGLGKMLWTDGSIYLGEWYKGIQHGYGIMVFPDGTRKEGMFDNNIYVGPSDDSKIPSELVDPNFQIESLAPPNFQIINNDKNNEIQKKPDIPKLPLIKNSKQPKQNQNKSVDNIIKEDNDLLQEINPSPLNQKFKSSPVQNYKPTYKYSMVRNPSINIREGYSKNRRIFKTPAPDSELNSTYLTIGSLRNRRNRPLGLLKKPMNRNIWIPSGKVKYNFQLNKIKF